MTGGTSSKAKSMTLVRAPRQTGCVPLLIFKLEMFGA